MSNASQAAVTTAQIPFKRDSSPAEAAAPGAALALLAVALFAVGLLYLLRRRLLHGQQGGAARQLRVLDSQRLSGRTTLSVVQFAGQRYLLAQGDQGVQCLAQAPGEANADTNANTGGANAR